MIIWLTGQPGSGKTTLAFALKKHLPKLQVVDGDRLRSLTKNFDYSRQGREKNILHAQHVVMSANEFGFDVCVAMVAPYRKIREEFKTNFNVREFYLVSSREDRKEFWVEDYEPPKENYILIDTDQSIEYCVDTILKNLK